MTNNGFGKSCLHTLSYHSGFKSPPFWGCPHLCLHNHVPRGIHWQFFTGEKKNIRREIKSGVYRFYFLKNSLNFAFLMLLIFLIFQVIPLPDPLLRFLSPEALVVGKKSLAASGALISEGPIRHWFSLSPHYYPVRMSIIRWAVYVLFFSV